jgi:3-oxoacyl-[acyl-carrier protein] reductase
MDQKYCVVLGASGEIGRAICGELAAIGWSIFIHYNNQENEAQLLQTGLLEKYPAQDFVCIQADFTKQQAASELIRQVHEVRAVVVATGQAVYQLLSDTTEIDMDALWKVHVQNPAQFIGLVSPQLRRYEKSYIVFIGSVWGNTGAAGEVMYSTVKGAQHAFVKAYAKESAYSGTRVNAVAPGWIDTKMNAQISDEDKQMIIDEIPLMTTGTPQDVAEVVRFLLSGRADYITGEILNVNGGWHI